MLALAIIWPVRLSSCFCVKIRHMSRKTQAAA
jgi:hypothetical protein